MSEQKKSKTGKHNTTYQLDLLKDQSCLHCGENFLYLVNWNKKRFKKFEQSYYELTTDSNQDLDEDATTVVTDHEDQPPTSIYYLHYDCLRPFVVQEANDGHQIIINGHKVISIYLFDRLGQRMTKINYLSKIPFYLKKEMYRLFGEQVRHLYKIHYPSRSRYFEWWDWGDRQDFVVNGLDRYDRMLEFNRHWEQFTYKNLKLSECPEVNSYFIGRYMSEGKF